MVKKAPPAGDLAGRLGEKEVASSSFPSPLAQDCFLALTPHCWWLLCCSGVEEEEEEGGDGSVLDSEVRKDRLE